MSEKKKSKKHEIHRGFVSLEVLGVLVIVAMAALLGAEKYSEYLDEQEWMVAARHASQFNEAAKQYIADHHDELLNQPLPKRIIPDMLIKTGYLQQGFADKNGFGQQYVTGMNYEMIKFFLSSGVPCGFADSEEKIKASADMTELLALNKDAPEIVILLEKIRTEKSPFFVIINLFSEFNKAPKVWQFHFLPLFGHDKKYLGTFFHAHEFLFLSPLEYVDGIKPYAVTTEKPNKLFTAKEWQVLFFTMHRLSSKQIARKLGIFPSTVEFYLKAIYGKVNVHSACQLRQFCKSKGFDRYIPLDFIEKSKCISTVYYSKVREVYGI